MNRKFFRRFGALLLTLALSLSLAAPAGAASTTQYAVRMDRPSKMTLAVGEFMTLKATPTPADAAVRWSTSDDNIIRVTGTSSFVESDGKASMEVEAVGVGKATITADVGGEKSSYTLTVEAPTEPIVSISLKSTMSLPVGKSEQLTVIFNPSTATNKNVTWSSSNNAVASVDAVSGLVTAQGKGTATITATADDTTNGTQSANCEVTVTVPPGSLTLNTRTLTLELTKDSTGRTLTAEFTPMETDNQSVSWSIPNNDGVVKITPSSDTKSVTIIPQKPGVATIKAMSLADTTKTATCVVTVVSSATKIELNKDNLTLTGLGSRERLTATVTPSDSTDKVTWETSDRSVVTVQDGYVTAQGGGTATITATAGNQSATCTVTVNISAGSITLNKNELRLPLSGTEQLTATVTPATATNKDVSWKSSDETVAKVDQSGKVTAATNKAGKATITATVTTPGGDKTATCVVTVTRSANSITVAPTEITLPVNGSTELMATVDPPDATDQVTWTSSKSNTAYVISDGKVDATGKVKGKVTAGSNAGTTTITATAGDKRATCTVTVVSMSLSPTQMSVPVGSNQQLSATFTPSSYTGGTVTWSSGDPTIATVDKDGKVTGVKIGTTVIKGTTTVEGVTLAVSCTVFVTAQVIPIQKFTLNPKTLNLSKGMQPVKLTPTNFEPADATTQAVTWSSSDPAVATVSLDGYVTAVGEGKATITATAGEAKAKCEVTVGIASVSGVTIVTYGKDHPLILDPGKTETVSASVAPVGADQTVTWSSANSNIAKVDANTGLVTAVSVGATEITATTKTGDKKATFPVEVSGVMLDTSSLPGTMFLNESHPVKIQTFGNASKANAKRNWTSSNPAVAAVNTAGTILARGYGTAKISVTYVVGNATYQVQGSPFEVTVEENDGTILKGNATAGAPYPFEDIMAELNRICLKINGHGLNYIANVSVPTSQGVLYYNHVSNDDTGFGVGTTEYYYYNEGIVGERFMSGITFVPNSEFNGQTTITYTGYDTEGKSFPGKIRLQVTGSGNVTFITKAGEALRFSATGFNAACRSVTGREIDSVSFVLPGESKGILCYGYSGGQYRYAVTEGEEYFRFRTPYLDQVSFVPAEYYIGTLSMPFHGKDTSGAAFTGRMHIIVVANHPDGEREDLTTTVLRGTSVDFGRFNFKAACKDALGQTLSYVRFTPPDSSAGSLYYNYSSSGKYDGLVNANTRYYPDRSPKLADVTFVPASGRVAPVGIDFVGYSTSGKSFKGTVTIYYRDADSGDDAIRYAVTSGQAIPFEPADFTSLCQRVTGENLSRIVFDNLPSSSEGTLYYNYNTGSSTGTKVTTSTNLYRTSLSGVAFAPKSDFIGTVELEFNGYTTSGNRFTGVVRIVVEEGNTTLRYNVSSGSSVTFDGDDFNSICQQATDNKLNYVRFQLPKAKEGKLQYRFSNSSTARGSVSTSTSYYYSTNGSNRLSNVYFTAEPDYTGTVRIDYTGFSVSGARFTGTVEIRVSYRQGTVLSYTTNALPFTIPGTALTSACKSNLTRDFSYLVFNYLPDTAQGRLYYDYVGQGTGTEVKTTTRYYPDQAPYLNRLVFVPRAGYEGTVSLPYTGYDTQGNVVSGMVNITVEQATTSVFSDMAPYVWAIPSVDFLYASGVVKGTGSNRFDPVSNVRRCDFVLMLVRMYNLPAAGTKSYDDVREDLYYSAAIASAKAQNVITAENGRFRPEEPITREDAMIYLYNAMRAANKTVPAGSTWELEAFADYNSVTQGARDAVTSMIHMGIVKGDNYRRLNPASPITRAETATVLHRAMTH